MTVASDYPDYQDYPTWRGPVLFGGLTTVNSASPITVQGYVQNFAAVQLFVQVTSINKGVEVFCQWFTDATLSTNQGQYTYILFNPGILAVILPNLGNYVQISISTPSVPNVIIETSLQPVNIPVQKPVYQSVANAVLGTSLSIGASGTSIQVLPFCLDGPASIFVECDTAAAPYSVLVQALNADGTIAGTMYKANSITGVLNIAMQVPSYSIQFTLTNNDVAARVFNYKMQSIGA